MELQVTEDGFSADKARSFKNISPLTDKDFTVGCMKRPLEDSNGVTPKLFKTTGKESDSNCGDDEHSGPARRRLSSLSSFEMNLIPEQMTVINAIRAGKSAAACHIGGTALYVCVCAWACVCEGRGGKGYGNA